MFTNPTPHSQFAIAKLNECVFLILGFSQGSTQGVFLVLHSVLQILNPSPQTIHTRLYTSSPCSALQVCISNSKATKLSPSGGGGGESEGLGGLSAGKGRK